MLIKYSQGFLALDRENNQFLKLNNKGNVIETIKNKKLNFPLSLSTNNREIAVANSWGNNVLIFDLNLNYKTTYNFEFAEPAYLSYYNNKLYVCNRELHCIEVFDENYKHILTYPKLNELELYSNVSFFMPTSLVILDDIIYVSQINRLTAIDLEGHLLFSKKNNRVFDVIKTNGINLFVLNPQANTIDIYGKTGIFLSSLQLPETMSVQTFEILKNSIICFSLFFEKTTFIEIENIPNEEKVLFTSAKTPLELMTLATIYDNNADFDKSLECYGKILKQFPGYPPVMKKLNTLINK